jgi:two-component sensor histidine kinase
VLGLTDLVADVVEDFSLLAQDDGRRVCFEPAPPSEVTADPKYARQIIHNLLTNALKHGQGDIRVRLRCGREACVLTIFNLVRREAAPEPETLGLGLRVVDTLLPLQPGMKCHRRRGKHYYAARLAFPVAGRADLEPGSLAYDQSLPSRQAPFQAAASPTG